MSNQWFYTRSHGFINLCHVQSIQADLEGNQVFLYYGDGRSVILTGSDAAEALGFMTALIFGDQFHNYQELMLAFEKHNEQ